MTVMNKRKSLVRAIEDWQEVADAALGDQSPGSGERYSFAMSKVRRAKTKLRRYDEEMKRIKERLATPPPGNIFGSRTYEVEK